VIETDLRIGGKKFGEGATVSQMISLLPHQRVTSHLMHLMMAMLENGIDCEVDLQDSRPFPSVHVYPQAFKVLKEVRVLCGW